MMWPNSQNRNIANKHKQKINMILSSYSDSFVRQREKRSFVTEG